MLLKSVIKVMIMGAASTVGSILAKKGIEKLDDPVVQAKIKEQIHKITNKFAKETEVA